MPAAAGEVGAVHAQVDDALDLLRQHLYRGVGGPAELVHDDDRLGQEGAVVRQAVPGGEVRGREGLVGHGAVPRDAVGGRVGGVARLLGDDGRGHAEQLGLVVRVHDVARVEDDAVLALLLALGLEGVVGVGDQVLVHGGVDGRGADLVEPEPVDGDVGVLVGVPGRLLVPPGPLENVALDLVGRPLPVPCVDVPDGLGVGELADGGQVCGPVAVAAVGNIVLVLDIAVPFVEPGRVTRVLRPVVWVDNDIKVHMWVVLDSVHRGLPVWICPGRVSGVYIKRHHNVGTGGHHRSECREAEKRPHAAGDGPVQGTRRCESR